MVNVPSPLLRTGVIRAFVCELTVEPAALVYHDGQRSGKDEAWTEYITRQRLLCWNLEFLSQTRLLSVRCYKAMPESDKSGSINWCYTVARRQSLLNEIMTTLKNHIILGLYTVVLFACYSSKLSLLIRLNCFHISILNNHNLCIFQLTKKYNR